MSTKKFRTRLTYYLIGTGIGLLFTIFIFGNRGCSWLPGNRVKNMIAEKEIVIGDSLWEVMYCAGITPNDIYNLLKDEGDVDFSKSSTHSYPKEYQLNGEKGDEDFWIRYALYDTLSEVIDFSHESEKTCSSTKSNLHKKAVPVPLIDVLHIIESHDFRILNEARCQMECLGLTEEETLNFHKSPKLDVVASKPRLLPNPYFILKGVIDKGEFTFKYIIGENRTRIADIQSDKKSCDCSLHF